MKKKAVILVSGGADSATVLAIIKKQEYQIYALSFDYGQKNKIELIKTAQFLLDNGVTNHVVMPINLNFFGKSSLTDANIPLEKYESVENLPTDIATSYVPARNTVFLSLAFAYAESIEAHDIFIGIHKNDTGNYPDCSQEFVLAFEALANVAKASGKMGAKINIHAPLVNLTKADIIKKGIELGVNYKNTISCYSPSEDGLSCGQCVSCLIRKEAFLKNNITDPASYL